MTATATSTDREQLRARVRQMWMSGDYDRFSRYLESGARAFYERLPMRPGCRVPDVACGSGQLALMAARDGFDVIGVDIAANLIARARERAETESLSVQFEEGDAEALPFPDRSFDVVASLIGAMFAPHPDLVARELLRVSKPGGIIAMANWTPQGFVGQMFKAVSQFIAPSGMPSPVLWGDEMTVRQRLGEGLRALRLVRRQYAFEYPYPPADVVELFRQYYGPTNRAFAMLDDAGRTEVFGEYLEVIGVRA